MNKEEIKEIREMYPKGAVVRLIHMDDYIHPVPDGTIGVVDHVDDAGQIQESNQYSLKAFEDALNEYLKDNELDVKDDSGIRNKRLKN